MIKKHAYLIIAHDNFDILEKQFKLLDDERNDLYVHIDAKCQNFDFDYYKNLISKGTITFIPSIDVKWGDWTQVIVELNLLEAACQQEHAYYHLISGVDLPIKTQNYIHEYFNQNGGVQYVGFIHNHNNMNRIKYYHFVNTRESFHEMTFVRKLQYLMNTVLVQAQKVIGINRLRKYNLKVGKGSNWFSITHEFAKYVVRQRNFILTLCKYSTCADEIFLQTLLINSPFYLKQYDEYQYNSNLRLIDWKRGNPYTFTKEDYEMIMNSDAIFARKFSESKDKDIVNAIYEYIKNYQIK